MNEVKELLTLTSSKIWSEDTQIFRENIASCINDDASLSPSQQSALTHIVNNSKQNGTMRLRDAIEIATWINSCHS